MACRPHAFVVMPFGRKPGSDGVLIDFHRVYSDLLRPALEQAGLEPFRADQEERAGDIRTDMFQELLLADLVLADLTIDNPNVWYELGVRHALRARGVVLTCGGRVTTAFDLYTDRKLRYGLRDGMPDPSTLPEDIDNLKTIVRATMESWQGRRISPVYALLPQLQEPEWKVLRISNVREFWEQHDAWVQEWRRPDSSADQMRSDATDAIELLTIALDQYASGFRCNPSHYDSGIKALTLMHLARHLTGDPATERWQPRQAILFSGHMMDSPERTSPIARQPPAATCSSWRLPSNGRCAVRCCCPLMKPRFCSGRCCHRSMGNCGAIGTTP